MTDRTIDSPLFAIRETDESARVHVSVSGDLDLATVPALESRLDHLRAERRAVRLDLSAVEYIDSTGVRLLVQVLTAQNAEGPAVEVEDSFTPHVRRVLELVGVDRLLAGT